MNMAATNMTSPRGRSHGAIWRILMLFLILLFCSMCVGQEYPAVTKCMGPHDSSQNLCSEPANQCPATPSGNVIKEPLESDYEEESTTCGVDEDDDDDNSTTHLEMFFSEEEDDEEDFDDSSDTGRKKVVSVRDFGAKGDGQTDDTEAFENAWKEACSSAPSIFRVPKGKAYVVKPVKFSGPCQSALRFQVSGSILAPEDPGVWKGFNSRLWLHFYGVDDLTVDGGGTVDGRGHAWWANSCKINKTNPCSSAPTAVTFDSMNNLRVKNLEVKDAQQMHVVFQKCSGVLARNLKVTAPGHSPNTDGIHVTGSKNVVIRKSIIGTGDDCISIVSGCVNIKAQDITCGPGHGISIGSLGKGNSHAEVSNIMVDGAKLHDTTNGVRIKTWQGGSGFASRITFKNIYMTNVSNPIIVDQNYCDSDKPCPTQASAVKIFDVYYANIKGITASKEALKFDCSEAAPCRNVVLENVNLTLNSGQMPTSYCANAQGTTKGTVVPLACF